ncbi:MAG: hypothetical protein QM704_20375 [Anaeromyxobacteraceae bacterium]
MPAEPQGPVDPEAVDGREVVGLGPEAVGVELDDRDVLHGRWIEALERPARSRDARGEVLEPRLVRRDLDALARPLERPRLQVALPALPRELVVVPDGDERPARARVLEVGVGEVAAVDGPVALEGQRDVEVADLVAVRDARDLVDRAVEAGLRLVRILDHLVDEVAEVQDEVEAFAGGRALVLEDHPAVGVELALVQVLAAHEGEVHRARIVRRGRGDRAADPAAVPVGVGEPVPVGVRRPEAADQHARRPVGGARDRGLRARDDPAEGLVLRHLDAQDVAGAVRERAPRPEEDAVRVGIAGRDPLRIQLAPLLPGHAGALGRSGPCE